MTPVTTTTEAPDWGCVPEELDCEIDYVADGFCDGQNNYAECQYDGGDCCNGKESSNFYDF